MKLYIKSMVSLRCKLKVREELQKLGVHNAVIDLGMVDLPEDLSAEKRVLLKQNLSASGLDLLDDHRAILIEKIKGVIIEMIHHTGDLPHVNYSDYISQQLAYDYTYLSNLFSMVKGVTIQQFIIIHKIEKVKELLLYDELTLTEISYKLHYSSVAHLSNQFKKVTGMSPTYFKRLKTLRQDNLESF